MHVVILVPDDPGLNQRVDIFDGGGCGTDPAWDNVNIIVKRTFNNDAVDSATEYLNVTAPLPVDGRWGPYHFTTPSDSVPFYSFVVFVTCTRTDFTSSSYNGTIIKDDDPAPPVASLTILGDSYASGEGNPPFIDGITIGIGCNQSPAAWGFVAGRALNLPVAMYACSGAVANDIVAAGPRDEAQVDNLRGDETLIALTIGGNDAEFSNVLDDCVNVPKLHSNPVPCRTIWQTEVATAISDLRLKVETVLSRISATSPNARIMVLGYPRLFPKNPQGACNYIRIEDQKWMNEVALSLNATIASATPGFRNATYVDTSNAFSGHELCSGSQYLNGVDKTDAATDKAVYFFHPNKSGHQRLSQYLVSAVQQLEKPFEPAGDRLPTTAAITVKDRVMTVRLAGLAPGQVITVHLHSKDYILGDMVVASDGTAEISAPVPSDIDAGAHTISFTAGTANADDPGALLPQDEPLPTGALPSIAELDFAFYLPADQIPPLTVPPPSPSDATTVTEPSTPGAVTEPSTPGAVTEPSTPGAVTEPSTPEAAASARPTELAATGSDAAGPVALAGSLLLTGMLLTLASRRGRTQ